MISCGESYPLSKEGQVPARLRALYVCALQPMSGGTRGSSPENLGMQAPFLPDLQALHPQHHGVAEDLPSLCSHSIILLNVHRSALHQKTTRKNV